LVREQRDQYFQNGLRRLHSKQATCALTRFFKSALSSIKKVRFPVCCTQTAIIKTHNNKTYLYQFAEIIEVFKVRHGYFHGVFPYTTPRTTSITRLYPKVLRERMGRTKTHYLQALHQRGPKAQGCVENSQRVRFLRHVLLPLFNHVFRKADWRSREKQVKDRLKKWGLAIKNVKEDNMLAIARKRLKRKVFDDKESAFRVNKQPLTEKNIDRFLKRKKISDCTLLSITSPINGEVLFYILI
jgi:hypothetical protein